jgi:hypothetical protein
MPTFKAPQYTKATNPKTGVQEPCYTFSIDFQPNEEGISFLAESQSDINLQGLQKAILENVGWWNTFIGQYLQASSKLFSKPYTVEQINRIAKHTLNGTNTSKSFPVNVSLLPKVIQIMGSVFMVNWSYTTESVVIDIPDLEEPEDNTIELSSLPVSNDNKLLEGIEELNIDELPVGGNSTDDALELDSPAKFYEKQRVKEARLKAKLAVYKAQRQMAQYYEKYGDDISDSDSEFGSSDEESGEESGEEEVQL